ncbi:MAG: acyltransferase [Bacteroidota bacterium]|nr:acyltransferase [Bacteroidota bacterium]
MTDNKNIYFSGLNGLRFFAALAVIVTHIELIKWQMGYPSLYLANKIFFELGGLGVVFFFVLSGFLITYLLLKEKEKAGTIDVKKFYLRRILRIWPLYFLITILGFFVLPHFHFMDIPYFSKFEAHLSILNLILFLVMLPNLAFAIFKPIPHIGQSWSIGVEEQFYLIWPWVVKNSKNILKTLCIIIALLISIKIIVLFVFKLNPQNANLLILKNFIAMFKIESMAIGGVGAWMVFKKKYFQKVLSNTVLIFSLVAVIALIYFTPSTIQDGIFLVYSVLFLIIILNVSLNTMSVIKIENKLFIFLGNISYGLYMYHLIVVAAFIGFLKYIGFQVDNSFVSQLVVYSGAILLTILVAWLSYHYFESWFLKLKHKFTVIKSGSFTEE